MFVSEGDGLHQLMNNKVLSITNRATSLLDALDQLRRTEIDVAILGSEFEQDEVALFELDARRRGFHGVVLHVVSSSHKRARRGSVYQAEGAYLETDRSHQSEAAPHLPETTSAARSLVFQSLTTKEKAVLSRVCSGWTNLQVARDLHCSEGSVKSILQQLFGKLGVRRRTEIVRLAFENGFQDCA
jgi:DNA-binding CsgD family transcriptional regulator